jgi:hypothetical protein
MKRIFLFGLLIFCIKQGSAQCFSTAFNNGSNFSTDNSTGGSYDFSIPSNSQLSDNSRATASSLIGILSADTYYLKATGFNFSIPSYASICGITVEVECRATGLLLTAAVRDYKVRLIKNGVITGNNYALPGNWTSTDAYSSYGGSNDLWGTTLTPADVNASNFGVAFSASLIALVAALPSAQIDHIRMKVDYNPILPVKLEYFKAAAKNKKIALEWKTTEEEDGASISLERSPDNNKWQEIARYEMDIRHNDKVYNYEDIPTTGGKYGYRLKILSASGSVTYSDTRVITLWEPGLISLYPNPAVDYIFLYPFPGEGLVTITDMYGKQWKVVTEKTAENCGRISLRSLPRGNYFIHTSRQNLRFIRQ